MARRRRRKSKDNQSDQKKLLIGAGAVAALAAAAYFIAPAFRADTKAAGESFNVAEYRRDASRFASPGNQYVLEGRIEYIQTQGNKRLIAISMDGKRGEWLPLLVPEDVQTEVNINRGDTLLFEVECKTGTAPDGGQVKGVLLVKSVRTK